MRKFIYNGETIIKIVVEDKKEYNHFEFLPFKKNLFSPNRKEGFYIAYPWSYFEGNKRYSKEEIENGKYNKIILQVYGKTVYYRPSVTIYFAGNHELFKEFNSYEDAVKWANDKANICIKIRVIEDDKS